VNKDCQYAANKNTLQIFGCVMEQRASGRRSGASWNLAYY